MIYLRSKYDIISVPSYAAGIYHRSQSDIISKIYHPFRQERISLKNDKLLSKLVVFRGRSEETRTPDILLPKQARYQLRYTPKFSLFIYGKKRKAGAFPSKILSSQPLPCLILCIFSPQSHTFLCHRQRCVSSPNCATPRNLVFLCFDNIA